MTFPLRIALRSSLLAGVAVSAIVFSQPVLAAPGGAPVAAGVERPAETRSQERLRLQGLIVTIARQNGVVPPELALAVGRIESNFKTMALSPVGARGVMQIMPATARGEFGVEADRLWDAETNIRLGIRFLAQLYKHYGYRWDAALSHYNGGTLKGHPHTAKPHGYTADYVRDALAHQHRYVVENRVAVLDATVPVTQVAVVAAPAPAPAPAGTEAVEVAEPTPASGADVTPVAVAQAPVGDDQDAVPVTVERRWVEQADVARAPSRQPAPRLSFARMGSGGDRLVQRSLNTRAQFRAQLAAYRTGSYNLDR